MVKKNNIIDRFLKLNPHVTPNDLLWRIDGRLEWHCEHGVGHTVACLGEQYFVHGCDFCCKKVKIIQDEPEK